MAEFRFFKLCYRAIIFLLIPVRQVFAEGHRGRILAEWDRENRWRVALSASAISVDGKRIRPVLFEEFRASRSSWSNHSLGIETVFCF
jgi:hypothetical protein